MDTRCLYNTDVQMLTLSCPLSLSFSPSFNHQELCAQAPGVSPEELGEDEGEAGVAQERR